MPNYRETSVAGTQWTRCNKVSINNIYSAVPVIELREEKITVLDNALLKETMGSIEEMFDPSKTIEMLDVNTDLPTGEVISYMKVYEILYSLYIGLAKQRDETPIE